MMAAEEYGEGAGWDLIPASSRPLWLTEEGQLWCGAGLDSITSLPL